MRVDVCEVISLVSLKTRKGKSSAPSRSDDRRLDRLTKPKARATLHSGQKLTKGTGKGDQTKDEERRRREIKDSPTLETRNVLAASTTEATSTAAAEASDSKRRKERGELEARSSKGRGLAPTSAREVRKSCELHSGKLVSNRERSRLRRKREGVVSSRKRRRAREEGKRTDLLRREGRKGRRDRERLRRARILCKNRIMPLVIEIMSKR